MSTERILFMGTPEFAVATLNALIADGLEVCGVVTAPDRPAGRGRQLRASAVKERALELGLPVLQPERLKDPAFHAQLDALGATLYVVVAFRMLPEVVWARPPLGTVNLHGSLLPAYRGAAPINWAVINGEERTGVTTFRIQHAIDTGDLLLQAETTIGPEETAGELHDRLMMIGAELMVRTVHGLFDASLIPTPQVIDATHPPPVAPKIATNTTRIDFSQHAKKVHDHVRGMSPFPGAWCTWTLAEAAPVHCKLLRTRPAHELLHAMPGAVSLRNGRMVVQCGEGVLEILELQLEGRKRMTAAEVLRGLHGEPTIVLK